MSEEQNKCDIITKKVKTVCALAIAAFILSIAALTLSVLSYTGHGLATGGEGKKVVISKQYDKGRSLAKAKETKKPIIVFFYTDWCGFCQRFAPIFHKITKKPAIKKNFAVAFVNCEKEENQPIAREFNVEGFPTVYVIDEKGTKTQLDNNTFFGDDSVEVVSAKALELIGQK